MKLANLWRRFPGLGRGIAALSLGLALPAQAQVEDLRPAPVLILMGQSQLNGSRNRVADLAPSYAAPQPEIRIWDVASQALVDYQAGADNEQPGPNEPAWPATVGPEAEYGRRWLADHPGGTLHLFKYTPGGSRFSDATKVSDPTGADHNWSKGRAGGAYALATANWAAFTAALAQQGKRPVVEAWVTDLGYTSSGTESEAAAYAADFRAWLAAVRADFLTPGTRIVISREQDNTAAYPYAAHIRAAQAAYVADDPQARLVDTDDLPLMPGDDHLTAAGQVTHGGRLYDAAHAAP